MDNTTNSLFNFFLDKSKSIGLKSAIFISVIGFLIITDFCLNFSYNLSINNKLEQLSSIEKLKKDYKNDSINFIKLVKLENDIIDKKHYSEYLDFSKIEFADSPKIDLENRSGKSVFSAFWMAMSSSFSLILLLPMLLIMPFFTEDKAKNFTWAWIAMIIIWISIIVLITVIAYQIPLINGRPLYNYLFNALLHIIFLLILFWRPFKKNNVPQQRV